MELHWGEPKHPMALRFHSGVIYQSDPKPKGQNIFYSRAIKSWFGFSRRGQWFIGFIRTGQQIREDVALTKTEINALASPPTQESER